MNYRKKKGRSAIEWIGVVVLLVADTIPVIWVLTAFIFGVLAGACGNDMAWLWRIQW
jgi:hypothetical protein